MDAVKDFYSPDEVAGLLDLHVRTIRRFIREGKLKAVRIGKQYRVAAQDLHEFVGSDDLESRRAAGGRQRRVMVSSTVDVDAISRDDSERVAKLVTGAFNSAREDSGGKRLDCIYYEEYGRLRIVVNADLSFTTAVLGLVNAVLNDDRGD